MVKLSGRFVGTVKILWSVYSLVVVVRFRGSWLFKSFCYQFMQLNCVLCLLSRSIGCVEDDYESDPWSAYYFVVHQILHLFVIEFSAVFKPRKRIRKTQLRYQIFSSCTFELRSELICIFHLLKFFIFILRSPVWVFCFHFGFPYIVINRKLIWLWSGLGRVCAKFSSLLALGWGWIRRVRVYSSQRWGWS